MFTRQKVVEEWRLLRGSEELLRLRRQPGMPEFHYKVLQPGSDGGASRWEELAKPWLIDKCLILEDLRTRQIKLLSDFDLGRGIEGGQMTEITLIPKSWIAVQFLPAMRAIREVAGVYLSELSGRETYTTVVAGRFRWWKVRRMLRSRDPIAREAAVESLGLDCPDTCWAEKRLLRLAAHPDENIRGMAVVALADLVARTAQVGPAPLDAIRRAADDRSELVRSLATHAKHTIEHTSGTTLLV